MSLEYNFIIALILSVFLSYINRARWMKIFDTSATNLKILKNIYWIILLLAYVIFLLSMIAPDFFPSVSFMVVFFFFLFFFFFFFLTVFFSETFCYIYKKKLNIIKVASVIFINFYCLVKYILFAINTNFIY